MTQPVNRRNEEQIPPRFCLASREYVTNPDSSTTMTYMTCHVRPPSISIKCRVREQLCHRIEECIEMIFSASDPRLAGSLLPMAMAHSLILCLTFQI